MPRSQIAELTGAEFGEAYEVLIATPGSLTRTPAHRQYLGRPFCRQAPPAQGHGSYGDTEPATCAGTGSGAGPIGHAWTSYRHRSWTRARTSVC
ncbi:hypothetical protein [Streptomyces sp. NBC_00459]|uniref:hypothetical protein n=1 Tax=Streptomyces sp. NBC_00459 TaxID=2975749 RepID=UPI002E175DB9